jgi:hypothetical protein
MPTVNNVDDRLPTNITFSEKDHSATDKADKAKGNATFNDPSTTLVVTKIQPEADTQNNVLTKGEFNGFVSYKAS